MDTYMVLTCYLTLSVGLVIPIYISLTTRITLRLLREYLRIRAENRPIKDPTAQVLFKDDSGTESML
jgi:4-hydroxybenzoate polyprenyltransferase